MKKNPHLDITGHVIKVSSDGEKTDKTKKAEGKAGAALFNVHVEFNGVSDEKKKQQAEAMEKSKEQQAKFAAKQEAKEKQKAASTMPSNPYDLLLGLDD